MIDSVARPRLALEGRVPPAMAERIERHAWSVTQVAALLDSDT
jgi:hypothetical protein